MTNTQTINQRMTSVENRNNAIDEKAKSDSVITIKEVYERVVLLEGKFEGIIQSNNISRAKFTRFVYIILAFISVDIFLAYLILRGA